MFVLTCFVVARNYTKATRTHSSLMLILFHFPASLPITVILNKEAQGTSNAGKNECMEERELFEESAR